MPMKATAIRIVVNVFTIHPPFVVNRRKRSGEPTTQVLGDVERPRQGGLGGQGLPGPSLSARRFCGKQIGHAWRLSDNDRSEDEAFCRSADVSADVGDRHL